MRDDEAILKLKLLESNPPGNVHYRVAALIELTSMFSQATVSIYIEQNKANHPKVKDLLLTVQGLSAELSIGEIASIAYASILFGGSVWISLPKMFNTIDPSKLEQVLSLLSPLIAIKFN
jgi:hypothetical protein